MMRGPVVGVRRGLFSVAILLTLLATVVACSGSGGATGSGGTPYTFHPDTTPAQVHSPQLRQAKKAAGIAPCPPSDHNATAAANGLPAITLPCLGGGRSVDLAGLRGPLVLNFWAQWCGPCREEAPLLQKLHERAGSKLTVLGVDWQDPRPGKAIAFADELGMTYPQAADPEAATRAPLRIQGLPMTLFVDRDGTVVYTHPGALTSMRQITRLVTTKLGVHLPPTAGAR